ncbi:MAG: hypothetical protein ATN35_12190 [Epulopiscium sp. Nele67-Bin004]|nr:MAG: hypothetical protein ATN35_12190 [Epulopiscium sp. Nele67-Bin004]
MNVFKSLKVYLGIVSVLFLSINNAKTTALTFIAVGVILAIYEFTVCKRKREKAMTIIGYSLLLALQISYVIFRVNNPPESSLESLVMSLIMYWLLFLSFILQSFIDIKNYQQYFFHTPKNAQALSFDKIKQFNRYVKDKKMLVNRASKILTRETIQEIIEEMERHSSFSYINQGSLTEQYFDAVEETLNDPYIYIVLSDTGSRPSQVISLGTGKAYNHSSISFDEELKTLISYNGGERVNPPGLNAEMIEYLSKKDDATIYVYKLGVTKEQKIKMLDKIKEINEDGSAYNILGLVLRKSYKPNIMYCSQFVYILLEYADAAYFETNPNSIKPTDLVEFDYDRKLQLAYKLTFN